VLYIDLDHFKPINDTLGHATGDLLLKQVSQRIQKCIRKGDTLARLGGDEFAVVLMDITDFPNAEKISLKILNSLSKPFRLRPKLESYVTASIGISMYPFDGQKAEQLLSISDRAMYHAKKLGMNQYCFASDLENFLNPNLDMAPSKSMQK
jgi:diguanylate cyclase (GGDEF)-like protein